MEGVIVVPPKEREVGAAKDDLLRTPSGSIISDSSFPHPYMRITVVHIGKMNHFADW